MCVEIYVLTMWTLTGRDDAGRRQGELGGEGISSSDYGV